MNRRTFIPDGFGGYEVAPNFGEFDPLSLLPDAIKSVTSIFNVSATVADAPRKAAADLALAKAQGATAERLAQLQLEMARANAAAEQAKALASSNQQPATAPKNNTALYVGGGVALVAVVLGLGYLATRK